MQSEFDNENPTGKCANCGKEIAIRDIRSPISYCGRACASMQRYKTRYKGTLLGKAVRSHVKDKMENL
mgnify:CR=1 FL=1